MVCGVDKGATCPPQLCTGSMGSSPGAAPTPLSWGSAPPPQQCPQDPTRGAASPGPPRRSLALAAQGRIAAGSVASQTLQVGLCPPACSLCLGARNCIRPPQLHQPPCRAGHSLGSTVPWVHRANSTGMSWLSTQPGAPQSAPGRGSHPRPAGRAPREGRGSAGCVTRLVPCCHGVTADAAAVARGSSWGRGWGWGGPLRLGHHRAVPLLPPPHPHWGSASAGCWTSPRPPVPSRPGHATASLGPPNWLGCRILEDGPTEKGEAKCRCMAGPGEHGAGPWGRVAWEAGGALAAKEIPVPGLCQQDPSPATIWFLAQSGSLRANGQRQQLGRGCSGDRSQVCAAGGRENPSATSRGAGSWSQTAPGAQEQHRSW